LPARLLPARLSEHMRLSSRTGRCISRLAVIRNGRLKKNPNCHPGDPAHALEKIVIPSEVEGFAFSAGFHLPIRVDFRISIFAFRISILDFRFSNSVFRFSLSHFKKGASHGQLKSHHLQHSPLPVPILRRPQLPHVTQPGPSHFLHLPRPPGTSTHRVPAPRRRNLRFPQR